MATIPLCLLLIKPRLTECNTQLCCVRLNKCSLFSNKQDGMAVIKVNTFSSNAQSSQETYRALQVICETEVRKHCWPLYHTDNLRTATAPRTNLTFLKPTGHVMHQQFIIQQLYVLPALYLCVLYLSENKQRLVPLTA